MGDVEVIKAAFADFSKEVRSSLKTVSDNLSSVQQEQAACGAKIEGLDDTIKWTRRTVEKNALAVGKLEVGLADVVDDTKEQWGLIRNPSRQNGFWDPSTKSATLKIVGVITLVVVFLLAGQSDAIKNIAGLLK